MSDLTSPLTRQHVAALLEQGVSLVAATRDERMTIELCRCAVARMDESGCVRVAIPLPEGQRTLANVEASGVFSLSAALPTNYHTVQIKGRDARSVEWPELAEVEAVHRARFAKATAELGVFDAASTLWSHQYRAIVFTAEQIYDQTPGPRAGLAL